MFLKTCLLFCFVILSAHLFAQNQNVYFLKNDKTKVSTRDSADYICIISEPDSGSTLFNIKEYYPNGKIKAVGKTSRSDDDIFEGKCVFYYPSGKRQQITEYERGLPVGDYYIYYPNGKLYYVAALIIKQDNSQLSKMFGNKPDASDIILKSCNDSTGTPLLVNGTGHFINYSPDFKTILDEGDLKDGNKNGTWNSFRLPDSITIVEEYDMGKLTNGKSTTKDGKIFKYTKIESPAVFAAGQSSFERFMSNHIRYPELARKANTHGLVFVSFIIEKDGSLSEFKILRDPGNGLGEEAVRVLKLCPKWQAGTSHGSPIRTQFTVPVNFGYN